ncbi:MAG: LemA family protein [Candidatus Omnitrophota bacterium]
MKGRHGKAWVGILIGIVVVLLIGFSWYIGGYNRAIGLDERVDSGWAQIENQLQRRNDLIPNLVNTVKGFAQQEREIFTEVTRLRSQWGQAQSREQQIETANEMTGALSRLLLVAENYPQLKSNENFLALQSQLEGTENRIAVERMRYNDAVRDFNQFRRSFFGRFFTNAAGVTEPAVYFEATEDARTTVPEVVF